ncbi:MAG TPA: M28 family peptidase [Longimicrobiales bacterium]
MPNRTQFCSALLSLLLAAPLSAQSVDTMALRARTRFLASDLLEGRGTGTRGEHLAGLYIASELMRMGVKPAGKDYLLPVPLRRAVIDDQTTTITLNGTTYQSVHDFVWNTGGRGALRDFTGPLTFVGAADSTAVARAAELGGRVAVMVGAMGAAANTFVPALIKAGAAGVVLLVPDANTFNLYVRSRGAARYFVDADVGDPVWQADLPIVIAGPTLSRAITANGVARPFTQLDGTLSAHFKAEIEDVASANVAGIIPGTDPKLKQQYVAFSAHYDHLGISTPDERADSIYNGFSDDAAGVAMVLGIGDVFLKQRPARSVLLLFFTGEERGLLGSSYYASHPAVPLKQMAGLINLDAGAPPVPPLDWRIAGGAETPLGAVTRGALAAHKWNAILGASSPNSDYWPFLRRGVQAVFIIPGAHWEGTTEAERVALSARWDHYHQAADEWSADFPFKGLQRYAEAALAVGRVVANRR